jgi:hypothetical protein
VIDEVKTRLIGRQIAAGIGVLVEAKKLTIGI